MKVCGEVVKIKNELAYVRTGRPSSCEGCANAGLCNKESVEIIAINDLGATVGDAVEVECDESRTAIHVIAYIFLVPVVILFLGVFLFSLFPWLAFVCLPLLCIYFVILRKLNASWRPVNKIVAIKDNENMQV